MTATHDPDFDSDEVAQAVVAVGVEFVTDGFERPPHRHRKAQLILGIKGLITCKVAKGLWLVPPQCAVWIPSGIEHDVRVSGALELYILFVDPDLACELPKECCTIGVSPLLRELIIETSRFSRPFIDTGPEGRLLQTMLDRLAIAPVERLHLPMPSDPNLRRIADAITANPSDRSTIDEWARRVGMSERTLMRSVLEQTGMSFGRWRQQFHIMLAIERLSEDVSVQTIAYDLGYESASAFISMFKKALGQPPARYLAARRGTTLPTATIAQPVG